MCCQAGETAFGARICFAANAASCAVDASANGPVFNAVVTVAPGGDGIVLTAKGAFKLSSTGKQPTFVEYGAGETTKLMHSTLSPFFAAVF